MKREKSFFEALERIKDLFAKKGLSGEVYLFGSSLREDFRRGSDIDMAILTKDKKTIPLLRWELEELPIPYKVDLVDLSEVNEQWKEEILQKGILIWKG